MMKNNILLSVLISFMVFGCSKEMTASDACEMISKKHAKMFSDGDDNMYEYRKSLETCTVRLSSGISPTAARYIDCVQSAKTGGQLNECNFTYSDLFIDEKILEMESKAVDVWKDICGNKINEGDERLNELERMEADIRKIGGTSTHFESMMSRVREKTCNL